MNILIKLLPVILITIIFYLLVYNLYPKYQGTLNLVQQLNEVMNKEKEIKTIEKLINSLSQNANLQQLLKQKDVLYLWLPQEAKIEELVYSLNGIYESLGLTFEGTEFEILSQDEPFQESLLPLKIIKFQLSVPLKNENFLPFIEGIEKNTRLMVIKKAKLSSTGKSQFDVESYYLPQ